MKLKQWMWLPFFGFILLTAWVSLTRTHYFVRDAMNYTDVGRNIAAGLGITQPAIGFNQVVSLDDAPVAPIPFTAQPPLFSISIALFHQLFGVDFPEAALLVGLIAHAWGLVMVTLIARAVYGLKTAMLTLGALCLGVAGRLVVSSAWSEPLAVALLMTSLYLLLQAYRRDRYRLARLLAAGLLAGLAFAARYVLILFVPVGLLFILTRRERLRDRLIHALVFGLMAVLPVLAVLGFNLTATGRLLPVSMPGTLSLVTSIRLAISALFGSYWSDSPDSTTPQLVFSALIGLAALLLVARTRHPFRFFYRLLFAGDRALLTVWSVGYIVFMVYWNSRSFFDNVGPRLLYPGSIILIVLMAALVVWATRAPAGVVAVVSLVMIVLASIPQMILWRDLPPYDRSSPITASPRLSWIAENTDTRDLLIAMDGVDIPFYLDDGRVIVSFSQYPYNNFLTYDVVHTYACQRKDQFRYILLVYHPVQQSLMNRFYGPFITDVAAGKVSQYDGIRFRGPLRLADGAIFRLTCAD